MKALFVIFALNLPFQAHAGETSRAVAFRQDEVLEALAPALALREATPDPDFGGKAPQIGWIKRGEQLRVLGVKNYISILGTEIWMEVQKLDDPSVRGWIFAGMSQDLQKGNSPVGHKGQPESSPSDIIEEPQE